MIRIAGLEVLGLLPSPELAKLRLSRCQPLTSITVCMVLQTGLFTLLPHLLNWLLFYCYMVFRPASRLLVLPAYASFMTCFSITVVGGLPLFDLLLHTRRGIDFETVVWTYWHKSYKTKLEKRGLGQYFAEISKRILAISAYTVFVMTIFVLLMCVVGLFNQSFFVTASVPIRLFEGWMNGGGYEDTSCQYGSNFDCRFWERSSERCLIILVC
jgi:hypothetical protein